MNTEWSLQRGEIAVAKYSAIDPDGYEPMGKIDSASLGYTPEIEEYLANDVSQAQCVEYVGYRYKAMTTGALVVGFMSHSAENLLKFFMGDSLVIGTTDPITDENLSTAPAVGKVYSTKQMPDPATVVITDSDAGPTTLVEGTHWKWHVRNTGSIQILDLDTLVPPFLVSYTPVASKGFHAEMDMAQYWMFRISSHNAGVNCRGERVDIYRAEITEEVLRELHHAAETRLPQPIEVTFTVDRDPARSYRFDNHQIADAA